MKPAAASVQAQIVGTENSFWRFLEKTHLQNEEQNRVLQTKL